MYESHATVLGVLNANGRERVRHAIPWFKGLADTITVGDAIEAAEEEAHRVHFETHQGDNETEEDDKFYPHEQ